METLSRGWPALALLLVVAGCGVRLGARRGAEAPKPVVPFSAVEGTLVATDGSPVDLSSLADRALVLIFANDTCETCAHETDALVSELASLGPSGTRVRIYTALVGATPADVADWQSAHRVSWPVVLDPSLATFRRYCTAGTVPCTVVSLPERGIVLQKSGEVSPEELRELVGGWK